MIAATGIYLSGGTIALIAIGFVVWKASVWTENAYRAGKKADAVRRVRETSPELQDYANDRELLRRARNEARAAGDHQRADAIQHDLEKYFGKDSGQTTVAPDPNPSSNRPPTGPVRQYWFHVSDAATGSSRGGIIVRATSEESAWSQARARITAAESVLDLTEVRNA